MIPFALALALSPQLAIRPQEQAVPPYEHHDANAGATPFRGAGMWRAFHGTDGVARIVDRSIDLSQTDPRISDIFKGHDMIRLRRTLKEQFCYILGGGCAYSGRTMAASHRDMGVQVADMSALVEHLQSAMRSEGIAFAAQNRFLAKLAPMHRTIVKR